RVSFLPRGQAKNRTTDKQVWLVVNISFEIHLRIALGLVRFLRRRSHAVSTVSVTFASKLLCLGVCTRRRRFFLQRCGDESNRRFPTSRQSPAGYRDSWNRKFLFRLT